MVVSFIVEGNRSTRWTTTALLISLKNFYDIYWFLVHLITDINQTWYFSGDRL
jgi:hypothetical protein